MKKLLLILSFLFCWVICFSQYPGAPQRLASDSVPVLNPSAIITRGGFVNSIYADTSAANLTRIRQYPYAQIGSGNEIWLRNDDATRWISMGASGSLVSTVNILNDSSIIICNINSCDTFVVHITGPITNITIINNTQIQVCGSDILGAEQITNGDFTGSATGWTLGTLWGYGIDNIDHSFGSTASTFQGGLLTANQTYTVVVEVGGTTGTLTVALDGGGSQTFNAGAGTSTFTGTWTNAQGLIVNLIPSNDFDGTVDNVSIKPVLPNCDTLQVVPTNFPLDDTIYVITPLRAAGLDTIYITQSGPTISNGDSGYLSPAGYDTFLYKVDTLLHTAANNTDILQFGKNGVITNWDTLDIVCYGLTNPGDVVWTGTGLVYDVTSANYRIDCKPYISPLTQITLNAADATNPRIDVIGVDSSGNAVYIPGTAAATPVTPQIDPSYQVYLTSILVPATATVAPIDTVVIYDENDAAPTNWTPVTNTGTTTNATNNIAGTVYRGAVSINTTNINNGDLITFTNSTTTQMTSYQAVVLFLKLKQTIPAAANLRLRWFNGATAVSNFVNLVFTKNNLTTFQAISVPLSLFTFTNTLVDRLQIGYTSNNATVNLGFYLDFIYLQNGVTPSPVSGTIVGYNFLTHVKNNGIDSIKLGGTGTENTTLNLNGKLMHFAQGGNDLFSITPTVNAERITMDAINTTGAGNEATITASTTDIQGNAFLTASFNGSAKEVLIDAVVNATDATITYTADRHLIAGRFEEAQGAALAAANNLTLGTLGNTFSVTGNTQINAITTANWQAGSVVRLIFTGTPTVKNNTAGGAGTATILLSGAVDFVAAANDALSLVYDGTNWHETARKTASGAGTQTLQQTFNTEVGGSVLTKLDTIQSGNFGIRIIGNTATSNNTANIYITNTDASGRGIQVATDGASGIAITGTGVAGSGIKGSVTTGTGTQGVATTGVGLLGNVTTGTALKLTQFPTATNTVTTLIDAQRLLGSGTAAAGIGGSFDFTLATTAAGQVSARIASTWTDATSATRTGDLQFWTTNSTTSAIKATIAGTGALRLYSYGSGTFTGTPTYTLQVDASGNVIEGSSSASVPINTLLAATGTNTIDNANYKQEWQWNTLTSNSALKLSSTSTAAASNTQVLMELAMTGGNANASQITRSLLVSNNHSGTTSDNFGIDILASGGTRNYALQSQATGTGTYNYAGIFGTSGAATNNYGIYVTTSGATNNIGGYFDASATGYAILVPASGGSVGIGTSTPTSTLHTVGSVSYAYTAQTGTYPITALDYTINCTANTFTTTLPTAVGITGRVYMITNSGAGTITLATTSSQTFANVVATPTTLTLATLTGVMVQSNGANWIKLNGF